MVQINLAGATGGTQTSTGGPVESNGMPPTRQTDSGQTWFSRLQANRATDASFSRIVANWESQTLKAEKRLFDQRMKDAKAEAAQESKLERMRRDYARRDAEYMNRQYDARRRAEYSNMRAEANHQNKLYDIQRAAQARAEAAAQTAAANRPTLGGYLANSAANHSHPLVSAFGQLVKGQIGKFAAGGTKYAGMGLMDALMAGGLEGVGAVLDPFSFGASSVAATGLLAAYGALKAPGWITNENDKDMSSAALIMSLRSQSADYGRMGLFNGADLTSMIYGPNHSSMLERYGLRPQDIFDTYRQYGQRGDDAATMLDIVASANQANLSRDLGGLGAGQYASWLGNYATLSRTFATGPMGSSTAGGPSSLDQNYSATNAYFTTLQRVMSAATMYGLDHSSVGNTLMQSLTAHADSGATNIDVGASASLMNRLLASGSPAMRDGSGIMSFGQAVDASAQSAGYGGNSVASMALLKYSQAHGGLPQTMSQLEREWGFSYMSATPQQRKIADQALAASRAHDYLGYTTAVGYLANQSTLASAYQSYVGGFGLSPVATSYALGALTGGYSNATAYQAVPGASLPAASGLDGSGPASMPKSVLAALQAASTATGVPIQDLTSLVGVESSYGTSPLRGNGGGIGQVTGTTLQWLQQKGLVPKEWTLSDLARDTNKSGLAAAQLYKLDLAAANGDPVVAAGLYNSGLGGSPNPAYMGKFRDAMAAVTGNDPDTVNNLAQQNQLVALNGQIDMRASNGGYDRLSAIFSGSTGDLIQSADNAAGKFQDASNAFAGAAKQFVNAVAQMVGQGMSGNGVPSTKPIWHGHQPVTP